MWRPGGDEAAQLRTQACQVYSRLCAGFHDSAAAQQHISSPPTCVRRLRAAAAGAGRCCPAAGRRCEHLWLAAMLL